MGVLPDAPIHAALAQLPEALRSDRRGCGWKSLTRHHFAHVVQCRSRCQRLFRTLGLRRFNSDFVAAGISDSMLSGRLRMNRSEGSQAFCRSSTLTTLQEEPSIVKTAFGEVGTFDPKIETPPVAPTREVFCGIDLQQKNPIMRAWHQLSSARMFIIAVDPFWQWRTVAYKLRRSLHASLNGIRMAEHVRGGMKVVESCRFEIPFSSG